MVEVEEEHRVIGVHDLRLIVPQGRAVADLERLGGFAVSNAAFEEGTTVGFEEVV